MNKATLAAALAAALTGPASAQDWLDNFNDGSATDGSPVMWVPSPAFGAQFGVTSGDLVVTIPAGASPAISSPRVASNFKSGASVRARMVAFNGPGRFTVAFADQPTGIQGYVASFSTANGGTLELFRGDVFGAIVMLDTAPMPYGPSEEFQVQLDVFNGVVSGRIWRPGEPFPATPQVSAPDVTYASGVASIAFQVFGGASFTDASAVVRFAQASSMPLTQSGIGDVNADGAVDVDDLVAVILAWGPCPSPPTLLGCPADVHASGTVDVDDLVTVILNWSR